MIEILVVIICIFINAILSAFEMGLVTVKRSSLLHLKNQGSKKATSLLEMRDNLEKTLSSVQVGITIVAIISGSMAGKFAESYGISFVEGFGVSKEVAEPIAITSLIIIVTYLTVVFGELVPKTLAVQFPVGITLFFFRTMDLFGKTFRPFVYILEVSTKLSHKMLGRLGLKPKKSEIEIVEGNLAIHKLSRQHRNYVLNLINIQKTPLKDVLLPWEKVVKLQKKMSTSEVLNILIETGHTRVPVCEGENVIGLINAKEFFAYKGENWIGLIRPIIKIQETVKPLNILKLMQEKHSHMSVVQSKTFSHIGVITLEDILEEIVGDIYDEDD